LKKVERSVEADNFEGPLTKFNRLL